MMWAKDYPLGTVIRDKCNTGVYLVNVAINGVRYWEDEQYGDLYTVVDDDLFEVDYY